MAELHPFSDGNSRTRVVLLQSELTRLGGHPILIPETWRSIYTYNSLEEVEAMILQGWCAYEQALERGGRSPYTDWIAAFGPGSRDKLVDRALALGPLLYDAQSDTCSDGGDGNVGSGGEDAEAGDEHADEAASGGESDGGAATGRGRTRGGKRRRADIADIVATRRTA